MSSQLHLKVWKISYQNDDSSLNTSIKVPKLDQNDLYEEVQMTTRNFHLWVPIV